MKAVAVRHWRADGWYATILTCLARLDEAFTLIEAGMHVAQRDGIAAHIHIWSMIRRRTLYCVGRLADARSDAEAVIEMADEIGGGSYGYVNQVCRYVLGRVAVHTSDPAGLAQACRTAAPAGQAGDRVVSGAGAWLTALVAEADGDLAPVDGLDVNPPRPRWAAAR